MSKETSIPAAARLARTIMSDITIYNTDRLQRGVENDRLFEELEDDLREGDKMWRAKIADDIVNGTNLYHKAFVDLIFAKSGHIRSRIF
jgi:hypothetical protein